MISGNKPEGAGHVIAARNEPHAASDVGENCLGRLVMLLMLVVVVVVVLRSTVMDGRERRHGDSGGGN